MTKKKSKNGKTSFFAPRAVVLTGAPPVPAAGTCGSAGTPEGIQGVTVPPPAQYDLITDLLDVNMFKVYVDMLKSDKHTSVGIQVH